MRTRAAAAVTALVLASAFGLDARADENLFGYVRGSETLPKGALEVYGRTTVRSDKGQGHYRAIDVETELEYGVTDRFTVSGELQFLSIDTSGLVIDEYLPKAESYALKPSGLEAKGKYTFLSPAKDDIGLAVQAVAEYKWRDPVSGQGKTELSAEFDLLLEKYFMGGQFVWAGNAGLEAAYSKGKPIAGLPAGVDWETEHEVEIELKAGTGLSYRFAPGWFIGAEALYETEIETEEGQKFWAISAGPSLHYGGETWWATLTWMPQLTGGGEMYAGQTDTDLHLIEKTKQEVRLKLGYNF